MLYEYSKFGPDDNYGRPFNEPLLVDYLVHGINEEELAVKYNISIDDVYMITMGCSSKLAARIRYAYDPKYRKEVDDKMRGVWSYYAANGTPEEQEKAKERLDPPRTPF